MTNEKLSIIRNNISDAVAAPHKPIDDKYLISDLRIKINMFDFALEGMKGQAEHSEIDHDDLIDLSYLWMNLMINLEIAVPLLEYVDEVFGQNSEVVELEDVKSYKISVTRLRGAIDEYREKNKEMIKHWESKGWR